MNTGARWIDACMRQLKSRAGSITSHGIVSLVI